MVSGNIMASEQGPVLSIHGHETERTAFSLSLDRWDHYLKYRPNYPDSLFITWLDYHRGPLVTAHELGTGCGIGAAKLMTAARARNRPIKHMIMSDPAESNIKTTKEMLQQRNQFVDTDFTFHQRPGEDLFLKPGSMDIVIACECLHWMDIRKAMASIHASLRPGGTFAAVYYAVPSMRIVDNERATEVLRQVLVAQRTKLATVLAYNDRSTLAPQLGMGLNFVPLDKDLWEDVTRTWINVPDGQPSLPDWGVRTDIGTAPPVIDPETETFRWVQDQEGWAMKDCTVEHMQSLFTTTYSFDEHIWDSDAWKDFKDTVRKGGNSFQVAFFATTILARKKA